MRERWWLVQLVNGELQRLYGEASARDGVLTIAYRYHPTTRFPLTSVLWWKSEDAE